MAPVRNINWVTVLLGVMGFVLSVMVFVLSLVFASLANINETIAGQQQFREKQIEAMSTFAEAFIDLEKRVQINTDKHSDRYNTVTLDAKFHNVSALIGQAQMQIEDLKMIDRRNETWMVKMDNRQDANDQLIAVIKSKILGD